MENKGRKMMLDGDGGGRKEDEDVG